MMCSSATPYNTFIEKLINTLSWANKSGVHIESMAHLQLPTYVPRFKVLNFLGYDMDSILHGMFARLSYAGYTGG